MPHVTLPRAWSEHTGGARRTVLDGATVADVLDALRGRYPSLGPWLDNGRGRVPDYVVVVVDGSDVRTRQGLETPVAPDGHVELVLEMAGGARP